MTFVKVLVCAGLILTMVPTAYAGHGCPGNIDSLHPHMLGNSLIVLPARVNQAGPYDFLVDTGAQVSTIDTSLAAALHLKAEGIAGVSGVATHSRDSYTYLDSIEVRGYSVANALVVIQDLPQLKAEDPRIRGILGDNFLEHFDLLIDYRRQVLCLDDGKTLAGAIEMRRVPLERPQGTQPDLPFTSPLDVSARLTMRSGDTLLLRLDSGSNAPSLFAAHRGISTSPSSQKALLKRVVNGVEQDFAVSKPQDFQIGTTSLKQVSFVTPLNKVGDPPNQREDGVLPTAAFQRVFISYSEGYAAFEPWAR
jgi:hypothetical protein